MSKKPQNNTGEAFADNFRLFLGSRLFFWGLLAFFVFQAVWIAFSAAYPLVYDELYHLTFIKIYAEQWSPFIASQDSAASVLGDITRTPSYLYHYLMSFPYRISTGIVEEPYRQIIILRLINVGFVLAGLYLFKKLFDEIKIAPYIRNVVLFITVLIPAFPLVAAHINYDNLLFMLAPLSFLLTAKFVKRPSLAPLATLVSLLIVASLVKHTFLVIAASIVVWAIIWLFKCQKRDPKTIQRILASYKNYSMFLRIALVAMVALTSFLAIERYGINIVQHHTIASRCHKIQPAEVCAKDAVTARNDKFRQEREGQMRIPVSDYTGAWISSMMNTLFGSLQYNKNNVLFNKPALPVLNFFAWILLVGAAVLFVRRYFQIKAFLGQHTYLLYVPLVYLTATYVYNYNSYTEVGKILAVQGRYLLVVLPLLILLALLAFQKTKIFSNKRLKAAILVAVMVVFLQGGVVSYIVNNDSTGHLRDSRAVKINTKARNILSPLIYEGSRIY